MKNFKGTFTALVTPFKNDIIDVASLDRLLKQQLDSGIDGFVVNGTTAESPTITAGEVAELFKHIRSFCGDKVPLIMGTGSNSTAKTIEDSKKLRTWALMRFLSLSPITTSLHKEVCMNTLKLSHRR